MKKKAVSMPLNTIIIALLVLAVLIVILFMFGSRMKIFGKAIHKSCAELGGTPISVIQAQGSNPCTTSSQPILIWVSDPSATTTDGVSPCCVPIGAAG